jgi:hypothetical protein
LPKLVRAPLAVSGGSVKPIGEVSKSSIFSAFSRGIVPSMERRGRWRGEGVREKADEMAEG